MRLHVLQHVAFENAAMIGDWAEARGHELAATELFGDQRPPGIDDFDLLAVMGGPMSVHDTSRFPWLSLEKDLLRQVVEVRKPLIGVCLGAQLIAEVLGGGVSRNPEPEIGWFPVSMTEEGRRCAFTRHFPEEFTAFHWHGETFEIPPGARRLAGSLASANQAFAYRDFAVGLQFHIEYKPESIRAMLKHCGDEIFDAPHIQSPAAIETQLDQTRNLKPLLFRLLDELAASAQTER